MCRNPKCGCDYQSLSRNQKYCSDECSELMREAVKKRTKVRAKKRKDYDANKEINRALSKSYSLCETVFELYRIPKVCNCKAHGFEDRCSGALERHHKDGNPFNNSPDNLEYGCRHHHPMMDAEHASINMVDTFNEAWDSAGFEDEDKKSAVAIKYTMNKIKGV